MDSAEPSSRPRLLSTRQASAYLLDRLSVCRAPAYLAKLRVTGGGPAFVRIGGRTIAYPQDELDSWAASLISKPLRSTNEGG